MRSSAHPGRWLAGAAAPGTVPVMDPVADESVAEDRPWNVIVWNDPVTLMSYVVFVLRKLFGYDEATATKLMLQVHHEGRAVVSSGPRDQAEADVHRLHAHGLQATMARD
jgi:ATP-dependent Clp protease adaptor protein ClpS